MRSKPKFGLLAAAVGLLFFLLLFVNTLSSTLLDRFIGAIENNSAQILVFNSESQATIPASRLDGFDVERVAGVDGVMAAAPISELNTEMTFAEDELDVSLWGIEPGGPGTPAAIDEGRNPGSGEVLVDTSARDAGITVGNDIEIAGVTLEVVGVATNATYSVQPTLYVDHDTFDQIFRTSFPAATQAPINLVGVFVVDGRDPVDVAAQISELEGLQGLTNAEAAAATPGVSSIEQSFGLITGITFVIVIVVVGFFFQILTVQKLGVFALLEALGSRAMTVVGYVLSQIGTLVVVGIFLGIGGLGVAALATRDVFSISVNPVLTAVLGGAVLVASLLSGVTSIRRILSQDVASVAAGGRR